MGSYYEQAREHPRQEREGGVMNLLRNARTKALQEYNEALAALPELRERFRMARAVFRATQVGPSITACRDARAVWVDAKEALARGNDLARLRLAAWKILMGIPQTGRDRSGRSPAMVETPQRRQDKMNAGVRKMQRWDAFREAARARMYPHANLQGAVKILAQEAFQDRFYSVTVSCDAVTVKGTKATLTLPRGGTIERENYLHAISHLTRLCYLSQGYVTIREAESWEGGGWVVEARPDQNPNDYSYMVTLQYDKARREFLRLTGVNADSDPEYLPSTAQRITQKA